MNRAACGKSGGTTTRGFIQQRACAARDAKPGGGGPFGGELLAGQPLYTHAVAVGLGEAGPQVRELISAGGAVDRRQDALGGLEHAGAVVPCEADLAAGHLARADALDPEYTAAWKLYGKALAQCGRNEDALAATRRTPAEPMGPVGRLAARAPVRRPRER